MRNQNIILITVDCLRPDFLHCYGSDEKLTPNIDKFAKDGVLFTQTMVNGPSTPFSFPSILCSSYPLMDINFPYLSEFRTSIAEILKENKFITAGFNTNPYLSKYYCYNKGFDYYYDGVLNGDTQKSGKIKNFLRRRKKLKKLIKKIQKFFKSRLKLAIPYERAELINKKALDWIKKTHNKFFVWIHYMDTHHPFIPPKRLRSISNRKVLKAERILNKNPKKINKEKLDSVKSLYKGTIRYVDEEIGKFLDSLKELNLYNNTLIVITSDHGEEFKEHGGVSHSAKVYDELIHVPLIIKGSRLLRNKKLNNLISLLDLSPTIIDYLNLRENNKFEGKSFLPLLIGKENDYYCEAVITETLTKNGQVSLSLENGFRVLSYRKKDWKFILNMEQNTKELYNLNDDPNETNNIIENNDDIAKIFEDRLLDHINKEIKLHRQQKQLKKLKSVIRKVNLP